jgi:hypothetical protein
MSGTKRKHSGDSSPNKKMKLDAGGIPAWMSSRKRARVELEEDFIASVQAILRKRQAFAVGNLIDGSSAESPAMLLTLQNGFNAKSVNVSELEAEDLLNACKDTGSLFGNDTPLDRVGDGIAFIDNRGWNATTDENCLRHMHFLAVLEKNPQTGLVKLSDTSERQICATTVGELRGQLDWPCTEKNFVAGKLSLSRNDLATSTGSES